jgi:hypothetical protein
MALPVVAYGALDGRPNVVVDGAPTTGTRITLSHWPHSGTPRDLTADVSAEIVFRYLERPALHVAAEAVSNSHFDEDGLMSVFTLAAPDAALERRDRVVDVAKAGDFATFRHRDAARVAFAVSSLADPRLSPLDPALFTLPYPEMAARLYEELLPRVPELLDNPAGSRDLWSDEDAHLHESERALRDGRVSIHEVPDIDLAIVDIDESFGRHGVHRFTQPRRAAVHPMAVHQATGRFRVMYRHGSRYHLEYRYESWVQYASSRPMARVDLTPLAAQLNERERAGSWTFDGVEAITPALQLDGAGRSSVDPQRFCDHVVTFLRAAPPAWDPYDRGPGT